MKFSQVNLKVDKGFFLEDIVESTEYEFVAFT
jgi:hypothetical protein